jgi:hypothetical protein
LLLQLLSAKKSILNQWLCSARPRFADGVSFDFDPFRPFGISRFPCSLTSAIVRYLRLNTTNTLASGHWLLAGATRPSADKVIRTTAGKPKCEWNALLLHYFGDELGLERAPLACVGSSLFVLGVSSWTLLQAISCVHRC